MRSKRHRPTKKKPVEKRRGIEWEFHKDEDWKDEKRGRSAKGQPE